MSEPRARKEKSDVSIRSFLSCLGPGLITGCADDDPSGITTYSVAGAAAGYGFLWTALLCLPLMVAVQMMCARLGMVTGRGLASVIRLRYPAWVLWSSCLLLVTANVINIAADLAGMGAAAEMVTHLPAMLWTFAFTVAIVCFLFWSSYGMIARVFRWTTLTLLSYVGAAFLAHADWHAAMIATIVPRLDFSGRSIALLLGILGTTISPYLFFWQASQEVEEERAMGRNLARRQGATDTELSRKRLDVFAGMLASNGIMYFIILTSAATLHAHGKTDIQTARQAAEALLPVGGRAAFWLFTAGLIGTGFLGVPVLAGSSAYALAEAAAWRGSLEHKPHNARKFYAVLGIAMLLGFGLDLAGVDAVKMLFWSAVINGALAPPLILTVILLTSNPAVMGKRANSPLLRVLGWVTFLLMCAATVGMLFA